MCNNKGHIHAALMLEYAQDAAVMEVPYKKWEYYDLTDEKWKDLADNPQWNVNRQYRRKKDYRLINGFKVPCPLPRESKITKAFTPYFACSPLVACTTDKESCDRLISRGMGFATFEEAVVTAKALLGIDPKWY